MGAPSERMHVGFFSRRYFCLLQVVEALGKFHLWVAFNFDFLESKNFFIQLQEVHSTIKSSSG